MNINDFKFEGPNWLMVLKINTIINRCLFYNFGLDQDLKNFTTLQWDMKWYLREQKNMINGPQIQIYKAHN